MVRIISWWGICRSSNLLGLKLNYTYYKNNKNINNRYIVLIKFIHYSVYNYY